MPTTADLMKGFELGPWTVLPERGLLRQDETDKHIEPLVMDVLVLLANHQGDVVNRDQLVEGVWGGRPVTDEVITRCIAVLRRNLEDDAKDPTFIETLPRRGYRLRLPVIVPEADQQELPAADIPIRRAYLLPLLAGFGAVILIAVFALVIRDRPPDTDLPIRSVMVFPFECMDPESRYLCFGFSEELTSTLYQVEDLKVVRSRSTYEAGEVPAGVDGVVTGRVLQSGNYVRILAELIDERSGFVVWSDTFNGEEQKIFELQEQVASALRAQIDGDSQGALTANSRPANFAAFDAYSHGQYLFEIRDRESIRAAIRQFQEAIREDPNFGPAYLRLAYAYLLLPVYDAEIAADDMYVLASDATDRGVAADPRIRELATTVYGFIHHKRYEWLDSQAAYATAINADTVYPITNHWYSRMLASVGRFEESLEQATLARERDPGQAIIVSRLAIANFWMNNLDSAGTYFDIANQMNLQSFIHPLAYGLYLIRTGRIEDAKQYAQIGLQELGQEAGWVDEVFDGLADPALAGRSREIIAAEAAAGAIYPIVEMTLWMLFGEPDRAMQIAMQYAEAGQEVYEVEILFIDEFRGLREHPDFPKLTETLGLNAYWEAAGCEWLDDRISCPDSTTSAR